MQHFFTQKGKSPAVCAQKQRRCLFLSTHSWRLAFLGGKYGHSDSMHAQKWYKTLFLSIKKGQSTPQIRGSNGQNKHVDIFSGIYGHLDHLRALALAL